MEMISCKYSDLCLYSMLSNSCCSTNSFEALEVNLVVIVAGFARRGKNYASSFLLRVKLNAQLLISLILHKL